MNEKKENLIKDERLDVPGMIPNECVGSKGDDGEDMVPVALVCQRDSDEMPLIRVRSVNKMVDTASPIPSLGHLMKCRTGIITFPTRYQSSFFLMPGSAGKATILTSNASSAGHWLKRGLNSVAGKLKRTFLEIVYNSPTKK